MMTHQQRDVHTSADQCWSALRASDWLEAFSHHPRIGDRVSGEEASEQAGAQSAESSIIHQLADVNRQYEKRFGHIFIVCATGKSAEEMLALASVRLHNDPATELEIAAEEQRKIMHLRLEKILNEHN